MKENLRNQNHLQKAHKLFEQKKQVVKVLSESVVIETRSTFKTLEVLLTTFQVT